MLVGVLFGGSILRFRCCSLPLNDDERETSTRPGSSSLSNAQRARRLLRSFRCEGRGKRRVSSMRPRESTTTLAQKDSPSRCPQVPEIQQIVLLSEGEEVGEESVPVSLEGEMKDEGEVGVVNVSKDAK